MFVKEIKDSEGFFKVPVSFIPALLSLETSHLLSDRNVIDEEVADLMELRRDLGQFLTAFILKHHQLAGVHTARCFLDSVVCSDCVNSSILSSMCTSYHIATRALANLSPSCDKLAKCPRGQVMTGLLQFELLCRIITERRRPTFHWISANAFFSGKNRQNAKACGINSDLFVNNDVSSQHRLGAESPSLLISHSQLACAWQKLSGYARLAMS